MINALITGLETIAVLSGAPDTTALENKAMAIENSPKIEVAKDTIKSVPSKEVAEYTKSNIEYHETGKLENSKGRINLFYDLPGNTKMYTFVELYNKDGFFARTMASTPLNKHKTSLQTEMKNSNMFNDRVAMGLSQSFNAGPVYGGVKVLPLWFDKNGSIPNSASVGGSIGVGFNVPIGKKKFKTDISAFGEMNVAKKGGPQWAYGEAEAKIAIPTKVGKFDLGVGYNFNSVGKAVPDPQFRFKVGYHPKR
jgi:hypothetical protein